MMKFRPGLRVSRQDVLILAGGAAAAVLLLQYSGFFAFMIAFSVLHFFLFCNVFRITRIAELIWAGLFIVLTALSAQFDLISWNRVVGLMTAVTLLVLIFEIRRPSYHGMFWKQLNPDLPAWWADYVAQQKEQQHM